MRTSEANGERVFQPVSFTDRNVRAQFITTTSRQTRSYKVTGLGILQTMMTPVKTILIKEMIC